MKLVTSMILGVALIVVFSVLMIPKHDYKIELNRNGSVTIMNYETDTTISSLDQLEEFITLDNI